MSITKLKLKGRKMTEKTKRYAVVRNGWKTDKSYLFGSKLKERIEIDPVLCGYYTATKAKSAIKQYLNSQGVPDSMVPYYEEFTVYRLPKNFVADWLDDTLATIRRVAISIHAH